MFGQGIGAGEVAVTLYSSLLVLEIHQHDTPFRGLGSGSQRTG